MGTSGKSEFPSAANIVAIIKNLRLLLFPGHFLEVHVSGPADAWHEQLLYNTFKVLSNEIETAFNSSQGARVEHANGIAEKLFGCMADIQQLLYKDAAAGFDGDPAAKSVDEVILTYPGFYAVFIYRVAHFLFAQGVPYIPRIMSGHAHSVTGIDIHPGAQIGEYFFIDHGTGVVIGETAIIGNNVKLYQGVTLGALSTKKGQKLAGVKRHPTLEDYVTVYSGATILGGETVIAKGSTVGGNMFITSSIPPKTAVNL